MARPKGSPDFFEVFRLPGGPKAKSEVPSGPEKVTEELPVVSPGVPVETPPEAKAEEAPVAPEAAAQEPAAPTEPVAPPETVSAPEPQTEAEAEAAPPEPPPVGVKPIVTDQGKVIITLSQEAFGAVVIVIILLIALGFAVGHWQARHALREVKAGTSEAAKTIVAQTPSKKVHDTGIVRREVSPPSLMRTAESKGGSRTVVPPAPRQAPTPVSAPPGPPEPTTSYWALQVIAGINMNKADELRAALEKQGYPNVVVRREGRYASVRLGRFDSKDSSEAAQFKKAITEMKYEGRTQFSGCYFVRVE